MPIRIRDVELKQVPRQKLVPHPQNPKVHGEGQRTKLRALFGEIGFCGALIVRPLPKKRGQFQVLDGHGRMEEFGVDDVLPCLVVKGLTDADAAKLIATYDPVGDLAEIDPALLRSLTAGLEFDAGALRELVDECLAEWEEGPAAKPRGAAHVEEAAPDQTDELGTHFSVLVQCKDEADQTAFLRQMQAGGRTCRVLNS